MNGPARRICDAAYQVAGLCREIVDKLEAKRNHFADATVVATLNAQVDTIITAISTHAAGPLQDATDKFV
ncbi:MAG: hypothetical protein V1750_08560 [Acidobacteriota bacterium]